MTGDEGTRRRYHSPLRREQAMQTRRSVVEAAGAAFAENGWEGTTMRSIAERAGVSVDTVVSVGTKGHLLLEGFRVRAIGEGGSESLLERDFAQEVFALTDPDRALAAVVDFMATAHGASADLWMVIRATALTDPAVATVLEELKSSRDDSYDVTLEWLASLGAVPLPAGDERDGARLRGRVLLSAEYYVQLTRDWGHTPDGYRRWLATRLRRLR